MIFRQFSRLVGLPPNPNARAELLAAYQEILQRATQLNSFYGESLRTIYQGKLDNPPTGEALEEALLMAKDELALIQSQIEQ